MKNIYLILLLACTATFAQTRLISHKSHSGNATTFNAALENNLFDIAASNFGRAPERIVKNAQLDSVIFINPQTAIMVTSEYCRYERSRPERKELWKAGRDTVFNHALFSRNHSLDSIKDVIKNEYYFENDTDKTVFVGYDNKYKKYKREKRAYKKSVVTAVPVDNNFPKMPMMLLALGLLSALLAFVTHYFFTTRKTIA